MIATDVKSTAHYDEVENSSRKRGKPIGYTVTRGFQVRVRDVAIFPNLVDELISVGAAEFSGINEGLTREKEIKDEIWGKALANAREEADATLSTVGMKVDAIFAISRVAFDRISREMFGEERVIVTGSNIPTPEEGDTSVQYRLAPVTVSQSVHVIYLISPAK